jgi:sulfur-oxidizing protein SoxZ
MNKPRVKVPDRIAAGDVIEVKTLISHEMETGIRKDNDGKTVPRNIIHTFTATFDDQLVFKCELQPGLSANPYLAFHLRVAQSGELVMTWLDDKGGRAVERLRLNVA